MKFISHLKLSNNTFKFLKKFALYTFVGFLIATIVSVFNILYPKILVSFDGKIRDYMFLFRGEIPVDNKVVIVDIDEKSLAKLGQWPWSRDKMGQILENLSKNNVSAIGFDVVFAEIDQSSPKNVFKKLNMNYEDAIDYDAYFNQVISNTPTILGYQFELEKKDFTRKETIDIPAIFVEKNKSQGEDRLINAKGTVLNHRLLQESAYSSGFFNNIPDDGGTVRSVPLIIRYDDQIYPAVSLEIIRASLGVDRVVVNYSELGVENIQLGDFLIPTDMYGRLLINYRGGTNTFKYISAYDIYANKVNPKDIEGKIVIIGTSASGLLDMRATPFESVTPGVEIQATAIDNIVNRNFLKIPNWVDGANLIMIFLLAILMVWFTTFTPFWFNPFALLIMLSAFVSFSYYILFYKGIVINTFAPLLTIIFSSLVAIFMDYIFEIRKERRVRNKFASKVSVEVMEQLLKASDNGSFVAMEKEVTISFSDVRNFTNISESMPSPKVLIEFLNEYMTPMTEIIISHKGTVDKFIGDAIMAYWNAPGEVLNHADEALSATLKQLHYLVELNKKIKNDPKFISTVNMCNRLGIEPITIGIGLNTGMVVAGEMGSKQRSDYTVIGDAVNLSARIESLCKYYDSMCNISQFTKQQLKGKYIFRFLDLVTVVGKKEPIEIWQVIDFENGKKGKYLYNIAKDKLLKELELYHRAIEMYKESKFKEALEIFTIMEENKHKTNKNIYKIYIERCEYYINEPPINFDGVFQHNKKGG